MANELRLIDQSAVVVATSRYGFVAWADHVDGAAAKVATLAESDEREAARAREGRRWPRSAGRMESVTTVVESCTAIAEFTRPPTDGATGNAAPATALVGCA